MKKLPPTVIALGLVSFFTDLSSEMIYPLMPLFMTTVLGASAIAIGWVEGLAESTASILKLFSGVWSDRSGKRKPFVFAGYGIAGLVRPLIGLATVWPIVLALRFTDRIGKGLRSAPRDALIADVIQPEQRGRAFGFHRALDHAGAVAGPLVAAALLHLVGVPLRWVFFAAIVPSVIVMLLIIFKVKETAVPPKESKALNLRASWRNLPKGFKPWLGSLAIFTLGNASDAFLLLALSNAGVPGWGVAFWWAAHNVVKLAAAYYGGRWTDRAGRRLPILCGWFAHILVYIAFALVNHTFTMIAVFLFYGLSNGLTEPVEKALVADMSLEGKSGAAFGWYHLTLGLTALPASVVFGLFWDQFGMAAAFYMNAALALLATLIFAFCKMPQAR